MSDFTDPEQEAKKDTRRAWKLVLGAFVLVFGLFVGVMLFYDCPPPDDSSIMPKFTESPGGYNPLAVFFEELKTNPVEDMDKELSAEARSFKNGSEQEMRGYLAKQTLPLQSFDKLIQTDPPTWRWPGGESRLSPWYKPDTKAGMMITKLMCMKAHHESAEGKMNDAVRTALQLVKFGHGLAGAEGSMIESTIAVSASNGGRAELERALMAGDQDAVFLASLQRELGDLEPKREDWLMTMKIVSLDVKKLVQLVKEDPSQWFTDKGMKSLGILFLKPNLTNALNLHYTKPVIDGLNVSWEEGWRSTQKMELEYNDFQNDELRFWISPNASGNSFLKDIRLPSEHFCGRKIIDLVTARQVILMLAIRRYELEIGKLPDSLEDLVPKYLPAVPIDPFASAPMRWNATTKALYSAGVDGIDDEGKIDGGKAGPKLINGMLPFQATDVGMFYWWSEEAKKARESKKDEKAVARMVVKKSKKPSIISNPPRTKTSTNVPTEANQKEVKGTQ